MLLVTLNAIFGAAAIFLALRALRHGVPFVRLGWMAIAAQVNHPDFRQNVFRRLAISEGGRFLIGGLAWVITGILALLAGIYFMVIAYQGMYGGG